MKKSLILIVGVLALLMSPAIAAAQGSQYVDRSIGVDVGFVNGTAVIPGDIAFGIVGVTGGTVYSENQYLATEASYFSNLSFYVNTGLNASASSPYYAAALAQAGGDPLVAAYDYGYNAGLAAVRYAQQAQAGTVAVTWWLDVETANTWNSDTTWNQKSLQGEHDALLAGGAAAVGVYSTTAQWRTITGGWRNGWPNWGATTFATAAAALSYATGHEFTGGPTYLLQYTPAGATVDYDVACPVTAKALTAFAFDGLRPAVTGTIDQSAHTVALTVPAGTDVTRLVATFQATGAGVAVAGAAQQSGATANDFTHPVTYAVTAVDGTTLDYVVTVALAPATPKVSLILSGAAHGVLRHGKTLRATGAVRGVPQRATVTLTLQKAVGRSWRTVKTVRRATSAAGAFSWSWSAGQKGGYRLRASLPQTSTHSATTSPWRRFAVK